MAGNSGGYSFIEGSEFIERLGEICANCGVEYDELYNRAIKAIQWTLARNPEVRPVVPGTDTLRIIKTNRFTKNNISYPVLRVWYRIQHEQRAIELLMVDMTDYIL